MFLQRTNLQDRPTAGRRWAACASLSEPTGTFRASGVISGAGREHCGTRPGRRVRRVRQRAMAGARALRRAPRCRPPRGGGPGADRAHAVLRRVGEGERRDPPGRVRHEDPAQRVPQLAATPVVAEAPHRRAARARRTGRGRPRRRRRRGGPRPRRPRGRAARGRGAALLRPPQRRGDRRRARDRHGHGQASPVPTTGSPTTSTSPPSATGRRDDRRHHPDARATGATPRARAGGARGTSAAYAPQRRAGRGGAGPRRRSGRRRAAGPARRDRALDRPHRRHRSGRFMRQAGPAAALRAGPQRFRLPEERVGPDLRQRARHLAAARPGRRRR